MQSVFAPGPAEPVVRGSDGAIYTVSSFGADATTFGPDWKPHDVLNSPRRKALQFRRSFARCQQHDWKMFDSQGRFIRSGPIEYWQPLLGSSQPSYYVPLDQRRPAAPVRLGKLITSRMTSMVYGHGRYPKARVVGDADATDFAQALRKAYRGESVFVRARNMGGSSGTVGLSWRFHEGNPRVKVHDPAGLHVHVWADRERCIVEHVTEIRVEDRTVYNPKTRRVEKVPHWLRRDWTPLADVVFVECPVTDEVPDWVVNMDETFVHGEERTHFVWIQNLAPDEDDWAPDGMSDYEGLEEAMLSIDTLSSVLNTGTIRNLDPTLLLNMDPEIVKRAGTVAKGSDNAITLGKPGEGDAKYLELAGTSTSTGLALRKEERQAILDTAGCVVPDPNEIAAAGTSGAAIELLFQPMLGQADLHRTQYGAGEVELLDQMLESARRYYPAKDPVTGELAYPVEVDEDGAEVEVHQVLQLPPREVEEELLDELGQPTGEFTTKLVDRHPGTGRMIELVWPEYFKPSATEKQALGGVLTTATGGKPVMSQRTGVELFAALDGRDEEQEWERLLAERKAAAEIETGMFPGIGGEVQERGQLPEGAAPIEEHEDAGAVEQGAQGQPLQVAPTQVLNGAQIQAAIDIVKAVVQGEMPRDAGIGQLVVLFNLVPAQAEAIMGSAGKVEPQRAGSSGVAAGATPAAV
jgi:hypothetical protein